MTKEEKQLLLKDLCGRLPYGVMVHFNGWEPKKLSEVNLNEDVYGIPYLRPMSSMTEEERRELSKLTNDKFKFYLYTYTPEIICYGNYNYLDGLSILDWLNAHHFDFRGLIEKGLALEAHEGMYKEENK